MAMQPEFHSANMNGADDAVELSSSCSSSSASSSDQSSPNNNPSISPRPILPPPALQLQADHEQPVLPDPAQISSGHLSLPLVRPTREQALKSLQESTPHNMMLRKLQKSVKEHQKDASRHKKAVRRLSKELYMIVSLYALLQGMLFTAVAQSSVYFTCADWWGPAGIMGAVTLGTIAGTLEKLHRMGHQKQKVEKFERRQRAVDDKIEELYSRGSACSVESLEPAHRDTFEDEPGMMCILSAQGMLVLGFLGGFSALITVSFTHMLCRPCLCHQAH